MATIAKCGMTGSVSLGGEITNWEMSINQDAPDATSMSSDGFHEHIGCLKFADGSFESLTACGAIGAHDSASFVNDVETLSCDIIVTGVDVDDPVAEIVKFKYTFISTGPVNTK